MAYIDSNDSRKSTDVALAIINNSNDWSKYKITEDMIKQFNSMIKQFNRKKRGEIK